MCPSFTTAMKQGKAVYTPTSPSLADGLTVPTVGVNALATGAPLIDKMVTVSEAWIAIAIQADRAGEGGGGGRRRHWACRLARWHVARAEGEEVRIGKDTDL